MHITAKAVTMVLAVRPDNKSIFRRGPITITNRWQKFRQLISPISDLIYDDYDHRLVT